MIATTMITTRIVRPRPTADQQAPREVNPGSTGQENVDEFPEGRYMVTLTPTA
jgi:hypothetical protein